MLILYCDGFRLPEDAKYVLAQDLLDVRFAISAVEQALCDHRVGGHVIQLSGNGWHAVKVASYVQAIKQ